MAWMETGFETNQEMRPWVSPSLIEANYILSLSQQELQNVIEAEMSSNPALELEDHVTCPICESVLEGSFCPTCMADQNVAKQTESLESMDSIDAFDDYPDETATAVATREEESDFDPMTLVASDIPLPDQILADARLALEEHEHGIAEYIIESLDERGFLTVPLEEIATTIDAPAEEVALVLEVIQDVAPIGVGARDLRECLLLQIDYLERTGKHVPPHTRDIVDRYLAEFGAHKFGQIARSLGISVDDLEEIRDFIRGHLNPFPLQSAQAKSWRSPTDARFVAPDVVIDLRDDELIVEVVDSKFFHLRTNAMYDQLATQFGRRRGKGTQKEQAPEPADGDAPRASEEEKVHVRQMTNRAKMFMSNIQQRRDTLLRISQCICELQESFLRGGVRELRPLTRALVAQQVGVHESTVSRATANKYVMLPTRKVIPFSDFFTPSLSTKDIIKEIIERETQKGQTLTDRKICDLLLQDGIRIARRTVAKYRAELGILPSTMR